MKRWLCIIILGLGWILSGCEEALNNEGGSEDELATVTRVIDGDTIDVEINGTRERVRYIGVNTPEREDVCYQEATNANVALVAGKVVRLEKDTSETDPNGRLLRYVYVGDTFVNAELVRTGYAEAVSYPPDTANFNYFRGLEEAASRANLACYATGIFDDGSSTR